MKDFMETRAEKRREVMIDLLIGLGIPILEMIFSECMSSFTLIRLFTRMNYAGWIISTNVYYIFEDFGPMMTFHVTPLSLALFLPWPVVISVVSFIYSCECPGLRSPSSSAAYS